MDIRSIAQTVKTPMDQPIFTGPGVSLQELVPTSDHVRVNIVSFPPGVRNKWHYHSTEQILIITAGSGVVATEQQEYRVTVGDVIRVAAGEKHWHGATADESFAHMYIMPKDSEITQVEE